MEWDRPPRDWDRPEALVACGGYGIGIRGKVEKERAAALEYEEMLRSLASLGLSIKCVWTRSKRGQRFLVCADGAGWLTP